MYLQNTLLFTKYSILDTEVDANGYFVSISYITEISSYGTCCIDLSNHLLSILHTNETGI